MSGHKSDDDYEYNYESEKDIADAHDDREADELLEEAREYLMTWILVPAMSN